MAASSVVSGNLPNSNDDDDVIILEHVPIRWEIENLSLYPGSNPCSAILPVLHDLPHEALRKLNVRPFVFAVDVSSPLRCYSVP